MSTHSSIPINLFQVSGAASLHAKTHQFYKPVSNFQIPKPMASTSAISLPLLPCTRTSLHRKTNRALSTTVSASLRNENYGRSVVDENLIVLRKRIHEMKQAESSYEPPAHWMEWEKKCYAGKDEFVCELMGLLQTWMMDARPCLVLGAILVVALSVPAAGAVAGFQMLAVIKGVLLACFPYLIN